MTQLSEQNMASSIVIVGLGQTGLSCVRYFLKQGIVPVVVDSRDAPPGQDELPAQVILYKGGLHPEVLLQAKQLVVSPGIAISTPEIAAAQKNGVEVIGDIELFVRAAKAPIIAITGSNGKSTVTTLVGDMANAAGVKTAIGGNIGIPALDLLDVAEPYQLYVLELSSFQLETTHSLQAVAATVLNVSDDHLDRYPDFEAYRQAKLSIYQNAQTIVTNRDDALTACAQQHNADDVSKHSFGEDAADYGLIQQADSTWLAYQGEGIISADELQITGIHNLMNALSAIALLDAAGVDRVKTLPGLKAFIGLAHRCEFIRELNGVTWINDTKATNVGATLAALDGLKSSVEGRLYLIAGGDGKGADFGPLVPALRDDIALTYCFGKDGARFAALADNTKLVGDLDNAIAEVSQLVQPGDWVLLSPACASIDMYVNFMARGDHFRALVKAL
ncbi:UDP-N-acetylmuramoyl-L-alanine--D-glutamate ligase [Moritella marina ATCC 15381]|uniref:UDP-N-acetylmuramoylalanine--D-glutamate ligase n=1 Tax=Moritella marina ATCC 15381 TaxID=1202962 RepID=A0A5J6WNQ1_MORMI|nr:UDP-N-acetylmuramoyl-L-alanine--D-glutamate ligase [Moritella marina]QFI39789.1 UDP-N-acetylmuramoyl-L-alanine--D-glutamate ligase [Moritella marina ATCC 15381]